MKTYNFGAEKLEKMSSKFIIELTNYLFEKQMNCVSIQDVMCIPIDEFNSCTIIALVDVTLTNGGQPFNSHHLITIRHANNMSCSNWQISSL